VCCATDSRECHTASGDVHVPHLSRQIVSAVQGEGITGDAVKPEPTTFPFPGGPNTCSSASPDSGGWCLQLASWRLAHTHPGPSLSRTRESGNGAIDFASAFLLIYSALIEENPACFFLPIPSVLRIVHIFVGFHEGLRKCQTLFCLFPNTSQHVL